MANPEHLEILKQGVEVWNSWRAENNVIKPDLGKAHDLIGRDLTDVNLTDAILVYANLAHATLVYANLAGANLTHATLVGANLGGANLPNTRFSEASLRNANLTGANLYNADFNRADLISAKLRGADLENANLTSARLAGASLARTRLTDANVNSALLVNADLLNASMERTILGDVDLSKVGNLESVIHLGPSTIGLDTIYKSRGNIPEKFLRGCGVPEELIIQIPALITAMQPIQFYSCFISYSSKDEEFAKRLYADLQNEGVRCWFAPEHMKIGERIRPRIDESIRLYDKLLLVLSENSVASQWVEDEVEAALEKEREQKETVLFPVRLDGVVMEVKGGWPAAVRRNRHIGDFSGWKNHDSYMKGFERLMRDLKAEARREAEG